MMARSNSKVARARPRRAVSFRQEVLDLHRRVFRRNQRRINASVFGYTTIFRRYEREYARGVRTYERRANFEELDRAMAQADVVYVGDYHTLAQAQRSFLRLVRRLPDSRPAVIALELIQARQQPALDEFLQSDLSEKSFERLISEHAEWALGSFANYRELLELSVRRGYRVIGIDAAGRGAAGATLEARDRLAARRIAQARREHPRAVVLVLVGELHVAPEHLPRKVAAAVGPACAPRQLTIYQNCEEVYWQLEQRGQQHEVEIVRVRPGEYCLNNTPPIVCQQSYLNWLEADEGVGNMETPEESFKEYARIIASLFDLPLGEALDEVEIATVADLSFLSRLRRRGDFSAADMRAIRRQILCSESYTIPRARMVYLGNLSINHASEEAAHFVRFVCAPSEEPKQLVDAFYARCLEEAIGFLGSKLINHKRKCPHVNHFEQVLRSRAASAEDRKLARMVLKHDRAARSRRVRGLTSLFTSGPDLFNALTHVIGYQLGDRLYYGLVAGSINKAEIRSLFFDTFEDEGSALATYLYLAWRCVEVKVPERF
jgi:hypothetical protein